MHRNPFPNPTPLAALLLVELVRAARLCYERGWSQGTAGNFSLRGADGLLWQSPTGVDKGSLNPRWFVPVDLESGEVVTPVAIAPSLEMPVHRGIYRAVPTAQAVVHTHPPHLVRASRGGDDLIFQGEEMQKVLGAADQQQSLRLLVLPNPTPSEMPALAETLPPRLRQPSAGLNEVTAPAVVLAGHGIYAWGRTPAEALARVEAAEFLCKTR